MDLGPKVLGLTGGIGMGKSTAAAHLAQRGVTVVDTDLLARQLVEPGQPALAEIERTFGSDVIGTGGVLRRDQLARRVFSDAAARERLEVILHPRIRQLWQSQLAAWRSMLARSVPQSSSVSRNRVVERRHFFCVVIPLLFETHAEKELDTTICIVCSAKTQYQRLAARGWSVEQIDQRIRSQLSAEEKMARADYVIWNEASAEVLAAQLDRVLFPAVSGKPT